MIRMEYCAVRTATKCRLAAKINVIETTYNSTKRNNSSQYNLFGLRNNDVSLTRLRVRSEGCLLLISYF